LQKDVKIDTKKAKNDLSTERENLDNLKSEISGLESKIQILESQMERIKETSSKLSMEKDQSIFHLYSKTREVESLKIKLEITEGFKN